MFENRILVIVYGPETEYVLDSYILRAFITCILYLRDFKPIKPRTVGRADHMLHIQETRTANRAW